MYTETSMNSRKIEMSNITIYVAVEALPGEDIYRVHREDGPAIICSDGSEEYMIMGEKYSKEEFMFRDLIRQNQ